ncbi:MAG: nuclear transport factor 2 family protein [Bacteroidota bacterium]
MYKTISLLCLCFCLLLAGLSSKAQSPERLEEINAVWAKFYLAFESLDHAPMAEIHSKELIRISGGSRISNYDTYINGYKTTFDNAIKESVTNRISLRFFERIHNNTVASERGIYQLVRTNASGKEQTFYGQFHVLFKKENGAWKIVMDYDSNEGNTIGEEEFLKAHSMEEFEPFLKN